MGGSVAITIRRSSGEELRMQRWTNSMPSLFQSPGFFSEDEDHLSRYLESWFQMKDDYERNRSSKNFEHNMTGVYFPSCGLSPSEYGLIVVDYPNKEVISCQGYCNPFTISPINLDMSMSERIIGEEPGYTVWEDFVRLYEDKRIKGCIVPPNNITTIQETYPGCKDVNDVLALVSKSMKKRAIPFHSFLIDPSPFTFIKYEHDVELERCYKHVMQNFELSGSEHQSWQESIKDAEEMY